MKPISPVLVPGTEGLILDSGATYELLLLIFGSTLFLTCRPVSSHSLCRAQTVRSWYWTESIIQNIVLSFGCCAKTYQNVCLVDSRTKSPAQGLFTKSKTFMPKAEQESPTLLVLAHFRKLPFFETPRICMGTIFGIDGRWVKNDGHHRHRLDKVSKFLVSYHA